MGIARSLPELEESVAGWSSACDLLTAEDYKEVVARWKAAFKSLIETRSRRLSGSRALDSIESRLPQTVFLFSGVSIPEVANLGGRGPVGYRAIDLTRLDFGLARELELVLVSEDFSWSCLFSHETGSMFHEEFCEVR